MVDVQTLYEPETWLDLVNRFANLARVPIVVLGEEDEVVVMSHSAREVFGEANTWTDVQRQWGFRTRPIFVPVTLHEDTLAQVVAFPHEDDGTSKYIAELLAWTIEAKAYHEYEINNLSEEILDKYEEVNLLYDLSEALAAIFETQRVCDIVLDRGIGVLGVEQAAILILDPASQSLRLVAGCGFPDEIIGKLDVPLGEGVAGTVALTGEGLLVEKVTDQSLRQGPDGEHCAFEDLLSPPLMCAPIQAKDQMIGVIVMGRKSSGAMFTAGDLKLLSAIASLAAVSIYNSQLVAELRDSERVKRELEIAQSIQMSLLPNRPPQVPGIDLAGRCVSATKVGGDYYDFFLRPDGTVGIVIADVSGHSVGAALMMAVARSAIRSEAKHNRSPAEVMRLVNEALFEDLDRAELFISAFYALHDPETNLLEFANGGHCAPIMWSEQDGTTELDAEGMLVGVLPRVEFALGTRPLHIGDVIVLYTDGVIEAQNPEGERYGEERLHRLLDRSHSNTAEEILDAVFADVTEFCQNQAQSDDITLVVMKVTN
jgi:serine phosphatase RsbU (regulator of sigma subunit)